MTGQRAAAVAVAADRTLEQLGAEAEVARPAAVFAAAGGVTAAPGVVGAGGNTGCSADGRSAGRVGSLNARGMYSMGEPG